MSGKTALLILAEGAEEMEAVIAIDVLRRANIDVTVASLDGNDIVECSRGVNIKADKPLSSIKETLFDVVILPGGGKGAQLLGDSSDVKAILDLHQKAGNLIAAICAAPTALVKHGIGLGKRVTSYPAMEAKMVGYTYCNDRVVKDGNLITSRGPGTAFDFALEIVNSLLGAEIVAELKKAMLLE